CPRPPRPGGLSVPGSAKKRQKHRKRAGAAPAVGYARTVEPPLFPRTSSFPRRKHMRGWIWGFAALAIAGCKQSDSSVTANRSPGEAVKSEQKQAEESLKQAQDAQKKASKEQDQAQSAQTDVEKARKDLAEKEQKAQQQQAEAQQAQANAQQQGQSAQQNAAAA